MKHLKILNNSKTLNQINKLLLTSIFCIFLLLGIEIIFSIPEIKAIFDENVLYSYQGIIFWGILWIIMFAQVTFIPIPSLPIYVICNKIPNLVGEAGVIGLFSLKTLFFCLFVASACLCGCILAYILGRWGGNKIVKWIAGDDDEFNKWCALLNGKKGKLLYAITVFFPLFPDDLISIVVGSLKMNFLSYVVINFTGKLVGAFFLLLFMRLPIINNFFNSNQGNNSSIILYCIIIIVLTLLYIISIILKHRLKN